jgi:hypothetical protein
MQLQLQSFTAMFRSVIYVIDLPGEEMTPPIPVTIPPQGEVPLTLGGVTYAVEVQIGYHT